MHVRTCQAYLCSPLFSSFSIAWIHVFYYIYIYIYIDNSSCLIFSYQALKLPLRARSVAAPALPSNRLALEPPDLDRTPAFEPINSSCDCETGIEVVRRPVLFMLPRESERARERESVRKRKSDSKRKGDSKRKSDSKSKSDSKRKSEREREREKRKRERERNEREK